MAGFTFFIRKSQFEKALREGFVLREDGTVVCGEGEGPFSCILDPLDSGVTDCPWGRLRFQLTLPANGVCYLYAAACNEPAHRDFLMDPGIPFGDKKHFLDDIPCLRFVNRADVLLYGLEGRYLEIAVEIIGGGAAFSNMDVCVPGDSLMEMFPEVYREKNSFFHRYLSIYSSICDDFQDSLDSRADMLDIEKAPKELLELFLKWLGFDVDGGFLDEVFLRTLLREAPELIRYKGTGKCIRQICRLFAGEDPLILEKNLIRRYVRGEEQKLYDSLYGDSPYDVVLFLTSAVDGHRKEQLFHLLEQFKPVRSRLHILFLEDRGVLDAHAYLDQNAVVFSQEEGSLDLSALLDGAIVLR